MINIIGTIHDNSIQHTVAFAEEIQDTAYNKKQSQINSEVDSRITNLNTTLGNRIDTVNTALGARIDGINTSLDSDKGFYTSLESLEEAIPSPSVGNYAVVQVNEAEEGEDPVYVWYYAICEQAGTWTLTDRRFEQEVPSLAGYATESYVSDQLNGYATENYVTTQLGQYSPTIKSLQSSDTVASLSGSGTVQLKTINDKSILGSGNISIESQEVDLSDYYTKDQINNIIAGLPGQQPAEGIWVLGGTFPVEFEKNDDQEIAVLKRSLQTAINSISNVKDDISGINADIATVRTNISSNITDVKSSITNVREDVSSSRQSLYDELDYTNDFLYSTARSVSKIATDQQQLQESINNSKSDIAALQNIISNESENVTAIVEKYNSIKQLLDNIDSESDSEALASILEQLESLQGDIERIDNNRTELSTAINSLSSNYNTHVTNSTQTINSLRERINTEVNTLTARIAELENRPVFGTIGTSNDGFKHVLLSATEYERIDQFEENTIYFIFNENWEFGQKFPVMFSNTWELEEELPIKLS